MKAGRSTTAGVAAVLLVLALSGAATALELPFGRKEPAKAGPSGYDVAGVHIGDSDREAEAALTAAGWSVTRTDRKPCAQGDAPPPPSTAQPEPPPAPPRPAPTPGALRPTIPNGATKPGAAPAKPASPSPPSPPPTTAAATPSGCVVSLDLRRDREGLREGLRLELIEDASRADRQSAVWRAQYMSEGVLAFTPNQFLEHATRKYGRPALSGVDGLFGWGQLLPQDKGAARLDRNQLYLLVDALRGAVLLEDPSLRDGKAKSLAEKFKPAAPDARPGVASGVRPGF